MRTATICILLFAASAEGSIENPTIREYPHLGRFYAHTGQHELAVATYRAMLSRHPDAGEAQEGWLELGVCCRELLQQALADLARAREEGTPKREIEEIESRVSSWMTQALAAYQTVLARYPASRAEAIIGTGNVLAAFGAEKADEARSEYLKVVDGYPEEAARAQVLIGDLLAATGDSAGAKTAYRAAVLSFPEIAPLAMMRLADLLFGEGAYGEAADAYASLVEGMAVDGAYNHRLHPIGDILERAIARRGEAERALGNRDAELTGYADAATRYDGTRAAAAARFESAEALDHYGKGDEAAGTLEAVVSRFPKSVWAARARMRLAAMRGASARAVEQYRGIADSWPQSIYWVEAQMRIADAWRRIADAEEEADKKKEARTKARAACEEITARWPSCPETAKAKELLATIPAQ
jgi:TolA-binding protein